MKPAAERLRERLAGVQMAAPRIPVVNNIEAKVETDPQRIKAALYEQAFGAVRWVDCIKAIQGRGVGVVIECGPGKVLSGMTKRIAPDLVAGAVYDPATLAEAKGLLG